MSIVLPMFWFLGDNVGFLIGILWGFSIVWEWSWREMFGESFI